MTVTIYTPYGSGVYNLDTLRGYENVFDYIVFESKEDVIAYIGLTLENCNKVYENTQERKLSNENNRKES